METQKRSNPLFLFLGAGFLIFGMLRISLPPVDENHHAFQKHGWDALKAYKNVEACPDLQCKKFFHGDYEGKWDCGDGKFINVVENDDATFSVVPEGFDGVRKFVYTSFTAVDVEHLERIIKRCIK